MQEIAQGHTAPQRHYWDWPLGSWLQSSLTFHPTLPLTECHSGWHQGNALSSLQQGNSSPPLASPYQAALRGGLCTELLPHSEAQSLLTPLLTLLCTAPCDIFKLVSLQCSWLTTCGPDAAADRSSGPALPLHSLQALMRAWMSMSFSFLIC